MTVKFHVISVDEDGGELCTSIGKVDPFVSCAAKWDDRKSLVGKFYESIGDWYYYPGKVKCFLPNEFDMKEILF